jgi:quercetin dioxygenase-like cupin family protein
METKTIYVPELNWEATTDFPGEAEAKTLRDEAARKAKTTLVRLHPGGRATPHTHVATVQHYILEGEYESEGKIYGAGTYRLLPAHADVGEITTQNGASVLMIYDPAD